MNDFDTSAVYRPRRDALAREEAELEQKIKEFRARRYDVYSSLRLAEVKELYIQSDKQRGVPRLKASATRAQHVDALVQNDVRRSEDSVRLTNLRRLADEEERILVTAAQWPTYEQVLAERREALTDLIAEGTFHDAEAISSRAFAFEFPLVAARRWDNVRFLMAEKGFSPEAALADVREDVRKTVIDQTRWGLHKSTNPHDNLLRQTLVSAEADWHSKTERYVFEED